MPKKLETKISIKVLEYSPKLSEDTYCYAAEVIVNGRLMGLASNKGQGGSTLVLQYKDKSALYKQAVDHVATLPDVVTDLPNADGKPFTYKPSLESVVDDLFDKYVREVFIPKMETARYKRACKNRVIYTLHSDYNEGFEYEMKKTIYSEAVKEHLHKKHGCNLKEIINERFIPKA